MSGAHPTVSVALCTYNGARFIEEQLDSIGRQTVRPIEVAVSDDCSSDETPELVERTCRDLGLRLDLVRNPVRLGPTENFIATLRRCRGDVIALCDQDDVWLPGKLERAVTILADPAVSAVAHETQWVDEDLRPTAGGFHLGTGVVAKAIAASPWWIIEGSRLIVRRRALEVLPPHLRPLSLDPDPAQPGRRQVHDEWAGYAASVVGRIVRTREVLSKWRRHTDAIGFPGQAARQSSLTALNSAPDDRQQYRISVIESRIESLRAVLTSEIELTKDERARIQRAGDTLEKLLPRIAWRAAVAGEARWTARATGLATGLATGKYGRQSKGAMGWLAAAQDLVALAPRAGS